MIGSNPIGVGALSALVDEGKAVDTNDAVADFEPQFHAERCRSDGGHKARL